MNNPRVIGIDLGTSNTCAAYADGRIPRVIPTERGNTLLPSIVAFAPQKNNANPSHFLVGEPAKEQMILHPEETVYGSKRFVGMPYTSKIVQQLKERFAYSIVPSKDGMAAFNIRGQTRPLTDVSAIILEQIARYSEAHLGGALDGVVITVPANYSFTQRRAVRIAAEQAGLDVWRLVNEPTAASLAYGVGRHVEQKVLVFDLGGGTFDVSILEIDGGTYQVLSTVGDGFLGGLDFDLRVVDYMLQEFEKNEGIRLDDRTVLQRIINAAEVTKCDLSLLRNVAIRIPFVAQKRGKPVDFELQLTRDKLNELTEDLMVRCFSLVQVALKDAGLNVSDIDEVLLVGGQTRMPEIQNRLSKMFGRAPRKGLHPDEVVAVGAAQLARTLGGQDVRLLDVLSVPVGVMEKVKGQPRYAVALERNEGLPAESLVTRRSEGERYVLDIFQGFGEGVFKTLSDVDYLGSVKVSGLKEGDTLDFILALDTDGILTCTLSINGAAAKPVELEMITPDYLPAIEPLPKVLVNNKSITSKSGMLKRLFSKE